MISKLPPNPIKLNCSSVLALWLMSVLILGCSATKPEFGWPNPRFDQANTAANKDVSCNLLDQP